MFLCFCFCILWKHHFVVELVQYAQGVIFNGDTQCPQITFERACPCLVRYLMRDKECLKIGGGGSIKAQHTLLVISRDPYCKWTRTECGKHCRKKGKITFTRERNGILLQSYSSSPRCATLTTDSSEGYLTLITVLKCLSLWNQNN